MNLDEKIRLLVETERTTGLRLSLRQIADKCGVTYDRLWCFMSTKRRGELRLDEAQRIYEALTGKPLLPESDESNS